MQQAPSPGLVPTDGVREISSRMTTNQRQVAENTRLRLTGFGGDTKPEIMSVNARESVINESLGKLLMCHAH